MLVAVDIGVVRVPKKCRMRTVRLRQDFFQGRRISEIPVGFEDDGDAAGRCIGGKRLHGVHHASDNVGLEAFDFVAENADVTRFQSARKIDESFRLSEHLAAPLRIGFVKFRRTADTRDFQIVRGKLLACLRELLCRERGAFREVQLAGKAAQFNGREAVGLRKLENPEPRPGGAA